MRVSGAGGSMKSKCTRSSMPCAAQEDRSDYGGGDNSSDHDGYDDEDGV